METISKKPRTGSIDVVVELDELAAGEEWPKIAAYIFNRSGTFLTKELLNMDIKTPGTGLARINLDAGKEELVIKVGPNVEDAIDLDRNQPFVDKVSVAPGENVSQRFKIPKPGWLCWRKVPYFVKGKVEKQGGAPTCNGEVDIYDVDIGCCFLRLPDANIEQIRHAIIDLLIDPPSLAIKEISSEMYWDGDWCGTGPRPPFPPKNVDVIKKLDVLPSEWAFAKKRFASIPEARKKMDIILEKMSLPERQAFLDRGAAEGVKISQVLYTNTAQFRKLLVDSFQAFRFFICWYPWIYWIWWPYCWYSLEKLGTAKIQPDGSFSLNARLSICRRDVPDLWFVVRQKIDAIERVIYARHPVPCNTYWNHPNGKQVLLIVTDPNAVSCQQQVPVPNQGIYVMPMGIYEDEWYNVEEANISSTPPLPINTPRGLLAKTDPYGTRLDLRMQFHPDLRSIHVLYYRWSFRMEGTTGDWTPIKTPISHRHINQIGGDSFIDSEPLGPESVGNEHNLFLIPDSTKRWLDNRDDLAYAIWHTAIWDGEKYVPQVSDGKYELRLEMFDSAGVKIADPMTVGFKYFLPKASTGPANESPYVENDGSLILHLRIDNRCTMADIQSVSLKGGAAAGECQFIEYNDKEKDEIDLTYLAYHPNDFLDHYVLTVYRGISGKNVGSTGDITIAATPASAPNKKSFRVKDLLEGYDQCAFAVGLHAYPRTRDGQSRIRSYEAYDTSAFVLVKKAPKE